MIVEEINMGLFDVEPIVDTTKGDKIKEEKGIFGESIKVGKELDIDKLLE